MQQHYDDLPEKERELIEQAGNSSSVARDMAIGEAVVRNSIATNQLRHVMEKADKSNKYLTKWLIAFTVIICLLTAAALIWDFIKYFSP